MPDLSFQITGVEPAMYGAAPLLHFAMEITNAPADQPIQSVMVQAQIQFSSNRRSYTPEEQERLADLFGDPDRWGQTLRTRLWTHTTVIVPGFTGSTTLPLPVPCTYDMNVSATKYFYALEEGDVPLLFLFSGTVFYTMEDGRIQAAPISWNAEAEFRMPVETWKDMMEQHYPDSAYLYLDRDVFERLYAFKRENRLTSFEDALRHLLPEDVEVPT
jgi:hypothetical protein